MSEYERLSVAVPRYTSYPTAPHFAAAVGPETYRGWLTALEPGDRLSLYIHIPWCDRLCWFCGCTTKQTLRYAPVAAYLDDLTSEIATVAALVGDGHPVVAIHYGGGSPTMLQGADLVALDKAVRTHFAVAPEAEISVEIDPNDMDAERFEALAAIGLTRASLGIQDFDPQVQKAINREQSFERTAETVAAARRAGARSLNCDLLYGLPHQSIASHLETVDRVLTLRPDRLAIFGYAHVPWAKAHQRMIDEAALPDTAARLAQMRAGSARIAAAGYQPVGIDHFALPADSLAEAARSGRLRRNFQGYTVDPAEAIIGLGASAIGRMRQGYVQNMPATAGYRRMVAEAGGLATVRGHAMSQDDRVRAFAIEQIMCDFAVALDDLSDRFGAAAGSVIAIARHLAATAPDLARSEGGRLVVVGDRRAQARLVAAAFDAYLEKGTARHSLAV